MGHIEYKVVQTRRIYFEEVDRSKVEKLIEKGVEPEKIMLYLRNKLSFEIIHKKDKFLSIVTKKERKNKKDGNNQIS